MRLANEAHADLPWRIHQLTADFRVEDVWRLPVEGEAGDFPLLVEGFCLGDPTRMPSRAARSLWALRWRLGELFGWDEPDGGVGERAASLRERLPADLRASPGPAFASLPFTSLYQLEDEWAAEIANETMHGVMHLGWVPDGSGRYRGQMAVLVKPNGLLGRVYMAAIGPFRHLVVYPPMLRMIESEWRQRRAAVGFEQ